MPVISFKRKYKKLPVTSWPGPLYALNPHPFPRNQGQGGDQLGKEGYLREFTHLRGGGWKIFAFNLPQVGNVFCFYGQGEYREMILTVILP